MQLPWYKEGSSRLRYNSYKNIPFQVINALTTSNQIDLIHSLTLQHSFRDNFDTWSTHIASNPLQLCFCHSGSWIMQEFDNLIKKQDCCESDLRNACMIVFEAIQCWVKTYKMKPVKEYHQKTKENLTKQFRQMTSTVIKTKPKDQQFKAYTMISLGSLIAWFIGQDTKWEATIVQFNCARDTTENQECKEAVKDKFCSIENLFVNALIKALIFTPNFAPKLALLHDWSLVVPFFNCDSNYDAEHMYPYVLWRKSAPLC